MSINEWCLKSNEWGNSAREMNGTTRYRWLRNLKFTGFTLVSLSHVVSLRARNWELQVKEVEEEIEGKE